MSNLPAGAPLRLHTVGGLTLRGPEDEERLDHAVRSKHLALLVFLAVDDHRGYHRRDRLTALLWPELDQAHARTSLRKALHHLRSVVGAALVARGHEEVLLDPTLVWCDARELKARARDGDDVAALELSRGEFLTGFHVANAPDFARWIDDQRHRLRVVSLDCAMRLVASHRAEAPALAARWAARAVEIAPLEEQPTRSLMELLEVTGDPVAALAAYHHYAERLREELELEPGEALQSVAQRIRRSLVAEPSAMSAAGARDPSSTSLGDTRRLRERPWPVSKTILVGGVLTLLAEVLLLVAADGVSWTRGSAAGAEGDGSLVIDRLRVVNASPDLKADPAISPDGRVVAYASGPLHRMRIYVQSVEGGRPIVISDAVEGSHRWPVWSPDGKRILFAASASDPNAPFAAWVVPASGGTPSLVIEPGRRQAGTRVDRGVLTPAWSPDGRHIAYADGEGILVKPVAGGPPTRVVGEHAHSPAFSPDGRRLAYVTGTFWAPLIFSTAPSAVCVVSLVQASSRGCITDSTHSSTNPVWSRDGGSVFFVSTTASEGDIYAQRVSPAMQAAGTARRLTTGLSLYSFALTPDGSRGVYSVIHRRSQVWMAPVSGAGAAPDTAITLVTKDAQFIEGLDLSPDGKWLVYDSNVHGNQDIYRIAVEGGDPIQLTRDPAPDFQPRFSFDGREIAYYSSRSGSRDVRTMLASGADDRPVTTGALQEGYPAWSPDGRSLVFMTEWGSPNDLYVVVRDSTGAWSASPRHAFQHLPREVTFPRWSPDGRWIAFRGGPPYSVWLAPSSGGVPRRLVGAERLGGHVEFLAWGPRADVLYVHTASPEAGSAFWEVPIASGQPRLLLRLEDFTAAASRAEFATDGRRVFYLRAAHESSISLMELGR